MRTCCNSVVVLKKMSVLFRSLWVLLLFLTTCAPTRDVTPVLTSVDGESGVTENASLWSYCTRSQALLWERQMEPGPGAALQAARCYAVLARNGKDRSQRLEDAVKGRKCAETAVASEPENGMAHYLVAYLAGLEAENDPLNGLKLVTVIECEALSAARLTPQLDHGGPDRMLGELYLRAPGPPVSIGDLEKALHHYHRAVTRYPDFLENRLGLAEAYLEDEEPARACEQLREILALMCPHGEHTWARQKALALMKRLCAMETEDH